MTKEDYIKKEMSVWGEDYVYDLFDRGYDVIELVMFGERRWWWVLNPNGDNNRGQLLWSIHADSDDSCNPVFTGSRGLGTFTPFLAESSLPRIAV